LREEAPNTGPESELRRGKKDFKNFASAMARETFYASRRKQTEDYKKDKKTEMAGGQKKKKSIPLLGGPDF